ncbi:MAG: hypothetical protein IT285_06250 [Bdellovibrionales bacterium]|nr:hypothetical protein [Bdellovibrionales bacterium]
MASRYALLLITLLPGAMAQAGEAARLERGRYELTGQVESPCGGGVDSPASWCLKIRRAGGELRLPAASTGWDGPVKSMPGHHLRCMGRWDGKLFTLTGPPKLLRQAKAGAGAAPRDRVERVGDLGSTASFAPPSPSGAPTQAFDSR